MANTKQRPPSGKPPVASRVLCIVAFDVPPPEPSQNTTIFTTSLTYCTSTCTIVIVSLTSWLSLQYLFLFLNFIFILFFFCYNGTQLRPVFSGRKGGRRPHGERKLADRQAEGQAERGEGKKGRVGEHGCENTRSNSIVIAFEGPVSAAGRDMGEGRKGRGFQWRGRGRGNRGNNSGIDPETFDKASNVRCLLLEMVEWCAQRQYSI